MSYYSSFTPFTRQRMLDYMNTLATRMIVDAELYPYFRGFKFFPDLTHCACSCCPNESPNFWFYIKWGGENFTGFFQVGFSEYEHLQWIVPNQRPMGYNALDYVVAHEVAHAINAHNYFASGKYALYQEEMSHGDEFAVIYVDLILRYIYKCEDKEISK